jgi:ADP-ribose pyrophosphatase YjhB (NUDIX family)
MTTDRRFCRFARSPSTDAFGMPEVPEDGLCLCAFVVLRSREHPSRVLLGQLDPSAPWDHLGALDPERIDQWKDLWMLPSSHLLVRESPQAAAARIVHELTGLSERRLLGPTVTSEVYAPERRPSRAHHWDLEFIFEGDASEDELVGNPAWRKLEFVEARDLGRAELARNQADILAYVGIELRS